MSSFCVLELYEDLLSTSESLRCDREKYLYNYYMILYMYYKKQFVLRLAPISCF